MSKTKQEIITFLESKLGTKVKCVGRPSLDGECVSLIKSLMEFIGVLDPYKARGNAKDCITNYLKEGISKPGSGTLSVYSNKDMGGGYGHIWCSINGTFYESNGVKPLKVTKGKTYSYDNVCNFDSYIEGENTNIEQLKADITAKEKTLQDITRQRDELDKIAKTWEAKYNECNTQRIEAVSSSDGFRRQFNDFVAQLATKLGTRQEAPEILASIDTLITYEDKALELEKRLVKEEAEHKQAVDTLEQKIKTLELNLETLKSEFKTLKESQSTPTTPKPNYNLWDIIKNILEKYGKK